MPNVHIVGGGMEYAAMFRKWGWDMVDNLADAEMLQFTGGEDVTPELYGHVRHKATYCNPMRDRKEQLVFQLALKKGLPMAGICRGGQFLNVMCGGQMWQDVDNHAIARGHSVRDERTGECFWATSTHHQMMIPHKTDAEIIATARESTWGEKTVALNQTIHIQTKNMRDIEVLHYPKFKVLCFQPHPEFQGRDALQAHYFNYLNEFFSLKANVAPALVDLTGKPIVRMVPAL